MSSFAEAAQDLCSGPRKRGFRTSLIGWFRRERRELPWRGGRDPYVVWVSEIMLQQTRVEQGTPYIMRFLDAFPTVHDLARAREDRVLKLWEGLGYYSRARNLHKAAKEIQNDHAGELPRCAKEWRELPGVGRYTAGAIASIAFDEPAAIVDGNVKRVLARVLDLDECIDDAPATHLLWEIMECLVRGIAPGDFNQAVMELGARICTPKDPSCGACPVSKYCRALAHGTQSLRPVRRARAKAPHYEIVIAAIRKDGKYLLGKRPPSGLLGGLWEFPGGKVECGEDHVRALRREVKEELGISVRVGARVASVDHAYSHFRVTLNVYRCTQPRGTPQPNSHTELRWVAPARFSRYAFPGANRKFLDLLD